MDALNAIERTAVEARARRLAAALIATHDDLDGAERRHPWSDHRDGRRALVERAQDLAVMVALLPRTHVLRLATDHALRTIDEWARQPAGTEDARAGSLSMVIAISMLRRAIADSDRLAIAA